MHPGWHLLQHSLILNMDSTLSLSSKTIPVIVGTRLLITCIARGPRRMRFKWFKGEYKITASDWTRISVSPKVIRNDGDLESVLEINPTSPLDRGTYRCAVSDKGVERSCSLNITVLTKPSAQLDPVTATVLVSSPVKLTCTVRSPGGVEPQVKWFIGKDRVTDLRAISNLGNGMYRLTVLGTVEGTKYTCMASNAAGTTVAESIVTVVRKDAHDVCGQETFQNVEWGMTLAGGVYYQLCPGGSTGYATRQCLLNELDFTPYWLEPNFVQCTTYDFEALLSNTRMLTSGIEVTSVEKIAETLNSITTPNLYGGNLRLASDIIQEMILYKEKTGREMSRRELEDVLWSASNVLSLYNKEEWMNLQETRMLTSGIEVTSVEKIAETLNSITTPNLYGGNLRLASDIIQEMILYKEKTGREMSRRELEDVLWSASNVLSLYNKEEWMNLQEGSSGSSWVLGNLTRYSRLVTFQLAEGQRLSTSTDNLGFCRSLQDYSGFYCECFEGFSGRHCQYNDICDYRRRLNPCLNNGTCTVVKYGAQTSVVCACQRGYLGERCEKIITCPLLQDPPNGKVSPPPCRESRSRVGETCYFTCDNTYVQSGPSFKTCLSDGYWTQEKESTVCRDHPRQYECDNGRENQEKLDTIPDW
uniref:Uncharacterized protein n=1 Tax=Branchiostoma floridae TaxID=7739 RepID=C3ZCU6_BRAFL|eukprot:XP_002593588.1 hypothetical protein BRAFLDRAFT_88161 [Branchiostoma floridae]